VVAALIVGSIIDFALAALLIAVSGFVLEGVNNTGPQMPEAVLLAVFVAFCILAPVAAWLMRGRGHKAGVVLAVMGAPPAIAILTLAAEPLLVR
jgi:hypothetical protein